MTNPTNHDVDHAGGVSRGTPTGSARRAEQRALSVLIGRWINEGATVASGGTPATPITTRDVYDWAPGGFFVLHSAYGRIGGDPATRRLAVPAVATQRRCPAGEPTQR